MQVSTNDPMVRHMQNQLNLRQADWLKEDQKKSLEEIIQSSLQAKSDQELVDCYKRFCQKAKEYTALQRFIDKYCNRWKEEGRGGGYQEGTEMKRVTRDVPSSFRLVVDEPSYYVKIWADDEQRAIIYYGAPDLNVFTYPDQTRYLQELQEIKEDYGLVEDDEDD